LGWIDAQSGVGVVVGYIYFLPGGLERQADWVLKCAPGWDCYGSVKGGESWKLYMDVVLAWGNAGEAVGAVGFGGERPLGFVGRGEDHGGGWNHCAGGIGQDAAQDAQSLGCQSTGGYHYYSENLPAGHLSSEEKY
jgi:hypothetical protein